MRVLVAAVITVSACGGGGPDPLADGPPPATDAPVTDAAPDANLPDAVPPDAAMPLGLVLTPFAPHFSVVEVGRQAILQVTVDNFTGAPVDLDTAITSGGAFTVVATTCGGALPDGG